MRKPVVSRTLTITPVTVMAVDTVNAEIYNATFELVGNYKPESKKLERILRERCEESGVKFIEAVEIKEPEERYYEIPVDEFVAYAKSLTEAEEEAEELATEQEQETEVTDNE